MKTLYSNATLLWRKVIALITLLWFPIQLHTHVPTFCSDVRDNCKCISNINRPKKKRTIRREAYSVFWGKQSNNREKSEKEEDRKEKQNLSLCSIDRRFKGKKTICVGWVNIYLLNLSKNIALLWLCQSRQSTIPLDRGFCRTTKFMIPAGIAKFMDPAGSEGPVGLINGVFILMNWWYFFFLFRNSRPKKNERP